MKKSVCSECDLASLSAYCHDVPILITLSIFFHDEYVMSTVRNNEWFIPN